MNRILNPKVDAYFAAGCGRCPLAATPECKVHNWTKEFEHLRRIILDCGLTEELKWNVPCYTFQNRNVLLLAAFKEYCVVSFMKGSFLTNPGGILVKPGENTQAERVIRFTGVQQVVELEPVLKTILYEAIEAEKSGLKFDYKKTSEYDMPEEFQTKLDENPALKTAFEALTPGRQRAYLLYFSQPKQSATRAARVERATPQILVGRGLHDR